MKVKKKIILFITVSAVLLMIVLVMRPISTATIKTKDGRKLNGSIAELKEINVGGVKQYILIRGNDISKPILLFIHGGPGQSEIGYIKNIQKELEENFVVVRWDQRGAGLSNEVLKEEITLENIISDTQEITEYLTQEFSKEKIYIAGHSWGTIVAMNVIHRNPDKYNAYVGISQFINTNKSEKISYNFTLEEAKKQENDEVIKELAKIGAPPYKAEDILVRAECLSKLNKVFHTKPSINMGKELLLSSEYDIMTKFNYMKNAKKCAEILISDVANTNFENITELKIPVYFIMGKYDYFTPVDTVQTFYDKLVAPKKELIIFSESGHLPQLEENEKFNETLIKIISNN